MGDEGSNLLNCQTTLVIVLHALSLLFWHFINTTAYHLGRYKPLSPSTKKFNDQEDQMHGLIKWGVLGNGI